MTDILVTTPDAKFGQPEITLGIIPGGGGTQRLASVIGKARTMDLVLTNRWITGAEAADWGLASRVTKEGESVVDEAVKVGDVIAGFGAVATQAGKEAVNAGKYNRARDRTQRKSEADLICSSRTPTSRRTQVRKASFPLSILYSRPERRYGINYNTSSIKLTSRNGCIC